VTDYTKNPLLIDSYPEFESKPWAKDLGGRILKVVLYDDQVKEARRLRSGDFCVINKTRVVRGHAEKKLHARLGGKEPKIRKLNSNVAKDMELKARLQRCVKLG
jgi:hypothetical protein